MEENESFGQWSDSDADAGDLDSIEFRRFEVLRSELMELEKRVKESADQSKTEEEIKVYDNEVSGAGLTAPKKGNVIKKSLDKLKETSMDVWQRTQLLTIDVAVAMGLMRRVIIGDELTEKEKSGLRRTVTAVGHAAMAAIQRYVPALIPSTFGPQRRDLLRKLQKVKEMETVDAKLDQNIEEPAS
ncbi:hypothetical protein Dimus_006973 [Dionaea muscipula]